MAGARRVDTSGTSNGEGRMGKGFGLLGGRYASQSGWEPTVVSLLILIVLEFFAFAGLRYTFRAVHGG